MVDSKKHGSSVKYDGISHAREHTRNAAGLNVAKLYKLYKQYKQYRPTKRTRFGPIEASDHEHVALHVTRTSRPEFDTEVFLGTSPDASRTGHADSRNH